MVEAPRAQDSQPLAQCPLPAKRSQELMSPQVKVVAEVSLAATVCVVTWLQDRFLPSQDPAV